MNDSTVNITGDEHSLWHSLHRIGDEISRYEERLFSKTHLTNAQYRMLISIGFLTKYKGSPIRVTDLVSIHKNSLVSISLILDRMETKGLIKKSRDLQDRRAVRITITPEGRKILHDTAKPTTELIKNLFSIFTEEELENAVFLMNKLTNAPALSSKKAAVDLMNFTTQQLVDYIGELSDSSS